MAIMENRAYALAAGMFTLLLGIGVVAAALWFRGDTVENDEYLLVSRYPVSGLNVQAPVRFRGLAVGKVLDIDFDPTEPRTILIRIQVRTGTPLSQGTYAQLGSQGVTGLAYVMLDDDGKKPGQLIGEGDQLARIEVRQSFMDSLTTSGQDMIVNFNQVAQRVNTLLSDDNQKQLVGTLRNLDNATGKFSSLATAIEPTVKAMPALLNDINEQPHSLLFGRNPTPPGPGEPGFGAQRGTK
jgi:phospholipid/cholesterol/gamma-HCH transport system substrate-binding protein